MSANANGTPTTNFSIPKFNTPSDAPNGKGVNEMMDAIDTLFQQRAPKITTSSFSGGPPGSPVDGDIWIATAVDANGTRWQFQYDSAWVTDANKWKFIGGPPAIVTVGGTLTSTAASYADVAGTPSIALARAGVYQLSLGATSIVPNVLNAIATIAVGNGGSIVTSGISGQAYTASATIPAGVYTQGVSVTAGYVAKIQAQVNGGATLSINNPFLQAIPIRAI